MSAAISVEKLRKTYRKPFSRRRVDALRGVSFEVERGEIFGFLGPNGAGKTTTIRILMGLIFASGGSARILGHDLPSREARSRLGFLPEAPYFYDYLNVVELLDLAGRIFGIKSSVRKKRAEELIELVGLQHAVKSPLKSFSKGMMQRAGIAQALINDPELVVFDEPMSGLDPVGRKEVRDIILSLRDRKKTVFFSSHILADVEMVADRIAIVTGGRLRDVGPLRELVSDTVIGTDVVLRIGGEDELAQKLSEACESVRASGDDLACRLDGKADVTGFLKHAIDGGAQILSVTPHHETLEDVFLRAAVDGGPARVEDSEAGG